MSHESMKCLIVDDVEENLIALEALLRRDGLEILRARSGAQALELLLVHEVALAVLDVQMPEMDGFELAELMRGAARTKHVPIIFVTAGARDPVHVFKGYDSGAVDFLHKPIDAHALRSKADVFFELYAHRRQVANALALNEMFVGILGHDLRNPLGAILTGAELLRETNEDPAQRRVLERMTSAAKRMGSLIDQLLDLTRARLAGGVGFAAVRQPVDVADLARRTFEELHQAYPEREVRLETAGKTAILGDPGRLLQLFSNLIANALQHGTASTPVVVDVRGEEDAVVARVRNAGVIPPAVLPTLFDPFRGRQVGERRAGLGLGLFIAQQIAVAHRGEITVESNEGLGTCFSVRLPRDVVRR